MTARKIEYITSNGANTYDEYLEEELLAQMLQDAGMPGLDSQCLVTEGVFYQGRASPTGIFTQA